MRSSSLLLLGSSSIALAGVAPASPLITPAPSLERFNLRQRQDDMDLGSLAEVLLTGVPPSILALALTNIPAVSRLLWSEFLDDNTPTWFTALPTDVQAYLSGEFGPTTAASNSASSTVSSSKVSSSATSSTPASSTAAASATAVADTSNKHDGGLPLWAKVLIGVLIPLFVLALLALLLLCCLRRRRRHRRQALHASSRTPTPAFISSSHRKGATDAPGEQHLPLRGGYHSFEDTEPGYQASRSSHHLSSGSDEYRTPIGGPSYENIPAPPATGTQHPRRNSRHSSKHSLSSLHSVPEMPEPMHNPRNSDNMPPIPIPPRSAHRSRDFSQEPGFAGGHYPQSNHPTAYDNSSISNDGSAHANPYFNQGIYAGGHNPYLNNSHQASAGEQRPYSDPFVDPSSPRHSAYTRNSAHSGAAARDPELFLHDHGAQQQHHHHDAGTNWPLRASEERGYHPPARTKSYDRYYERANVYEM